MIKLQTPVTDAPCKVGISYNDRILLLGSCFTDNIGTMLKNYGFNVCCNPFGTLYNPASILSSIKRLCSGEPFVSEDCIEIGAGDMRTCSFYHHTSFARQTPAEFIENANAALAEACEFFKGCNKIIITLGTSWCFRHLQKDMIVSNCLKRNPNEFTRELLELKEVSGILTEIMSLCPGKEFIFTVSPIRHFKDGAHGNQLSKATLLLGINEAIKDKEVRVVDDEGNQLGVMSAAEALRLAEAKNLDLVKIAPRAVPPVCKIIDFGKYCYEQAKKEKEAKKNQNIISVKEIQLTLKIDVHDLQTKAGHAIKFLKNGDKVKVVVKYKGRELAHTELGFDIADRFVALLDDSAVIEKPAKIEGRNMILILAPNPALKSKK